MTGNAANAASGRESITVPMLIRTVTISRSSCG